MKMISVGKISFTAPDELEEPIRANYFNNMPLLKEKYPEIAHLVRTAETDISAFSITKENEAAFIFYTLGGKRFKYNAVPQENLILSDENKNAFSKAGCVFSDVFPGDWLVELLQIPLSDSVLINNYSSRIPTYVIEKSIDRFRAILSLYNLRDVLSDGRFMFFVGKESLSEFKSHLLDEQIRLPVFVQDSDSSEEIKNILQHVQKMKGEEVKHLLQSLQAYYAAKDFKTWSDTFNNKKLNIIIGVSQFTRVLKHVAGDLSEGFRQLGHHASVLTEKNRFSITTPFSHLRAYDKLKPELILITSHIRPEFPFIPTNIPFVSYLQDTLPQVMNPENTRKTGAHDIIIPADYVFQEKRLLKYGYPEENIHNIHFLVTNTQTYHPMDLSEDDIHQYGCPVSFVSNNSQSPLEKLLELRKPTFSTQLDASFRENLDDALDSLYKDVENLYAQGNTLWSEFQYEEIFREILKKKNVHIEAPTKYSLVSYFWGYIGGKFLRHNVLRWLKEEGMNFRLYGAGWENNPEFSQYSCGIAQYGEEVCKIFNASKINLHIDFSTLHFRLCDGFASGGFFLLNYTPLCELPQKMPEIRLLLESVRRPLTVDEICIKCEDSVAADLLRFMFYTDLHKAGSDPVSMEEIKQLMHSNMPEDYVRFAEFMSYKNLKDIYYKTKEEFIEKINYYLTHEDERGKIIEKAQRFIHDYTYKHLCENILKAAAQHFTKLAARTKETGHTIPHPQSIRAEMPNK